MSNYYSEHESMQLETNDDVYNRLIRSFETRMMTQCRYDSFCCYMKNHCDILFTRDIMDFLEDYNAIISQAVQAIRSLQAENNQLKEMKVIEGKQFNTKDIRSNEINNNASNKGNNDEGNAISNDNTINNTNVNANRDKENAKDNEFNGNTNTNPIAKSDKANDDIVDTNDNIINNNDIVIKQPLRQQLRQLSKGKQSSSTSNINKSLYITQDKCMSVTNNSLQQPNAYNNSIELDNQKQQNEIEYNRELETIQKTNEILKQIPVIQHSQKHFLSNYCPNQSLKEFLSRIIEYKYDTQTINDILIDIQRLKPQDNDIQTYSNKLQSTSKNKPRVTHHSFSGSLRTYNSNNIKKQDEGSNNQKPFVQFTSPYGRLFKNSG